MQQQNSDGFSLVELTVSMGILAVLAVSVLASFGTALRADRMASQLLEATNSAQSTMEVAASTDYSLLFSLNGTSITSGSTKSDISVLAIGSAVVHITVRTIHADNDEAIVSLYTFVANPE